MAWTKEKKREWSKEYRQRPEVKARPRNRNRERDVATVMAWRKKNPEKCMAATKKYLNKSEKFAKVRVGRKRVQARRHNIPFDLTEAWFETMLAGKCPMTGHEFDIGMENWKSPWYPEVDRIDPDGGYVMSNCRLVASIYNRAKMYWRDSDVLEMAEKIVGRERAHAR